MLTRHKILKAISVIGSPHQLYYALTWPVYSASSAFLVSALVRQGVNPRTVIDVGANVGQFACSAAKLWAGSRVISFEPNPDAFARLIRNTRGVPSITCIELALGARQSNEELRVNSYSHSSSVLPLAAPHQEAFPHAVEQSRVPVKMSTLDHALEKERLTGPTLLKMDVQGYELEVLKGAEGLLSSVQYILCEVSFVSLYQGEPLFMEVAEHLKSVGFEFRRPIGWLRHPRTDEILQMDALFERRRS